MQPEDIEMVILHCSATPPEMDIGVKEIDRWHRKRGWLRIGYHWVIRRNGNLEAGRDESQAGAHTIGFNNKSIGICIVGGIRDTDSMAPEDNFTDEQWETLKDLLSRLQAIYPTAKIIGHRDVDKDRACPCFEVKDWVANNLPVS